MVYFAKKFKEKCIQLLFFVLETKGIWLRGLLCLFLALSVFYLDNPYSHDLRFQIRGKQNVNKDLLLIEIPISEWAQLTGESNSPTTSPIPDSYFWNQNLWENILSKIISSNPRSISISFYFDQNIEFKQTPKFSIFFHPKIIWAAQIDNEGRILNPKFTNSQKNNIGLINSFHQNSGNLTRTFSNVSKIIPHITLKLTSSTLPTNEKREINLRGPQGTFPSITLSELLNNKNISKKLKNKKIIIGATGTNRHSYRTALGDLSKAEVLANIADNILEKRWIQKVNNKFSILFIFLLCCICIWIVSSYPQNYSLLFFFWIGLSITACSLWFFDSFNYWTPIMASLTLLTSVYIIFLSHQLGIKESLNWGLEQQRKYQLENEELKNNFVSLISHDLKTPIAKMQAICDRLLLDSSDQKTNKDLKALRNESSELHKYIQSILQITRVESQNFKINKQSADTNKLIKKALEQVDELAKKKNIEIKHKLEPIFLIEIDKVLIGQVILNIIENAIKYTPKGGKIEVTSAEIKNNVVVKIKDNGVGIKKEDQKLVFQKFYRTVDSSNQNKGSGLGLYLVKYFIELHGGQVYLESSYQNETTVSFTLPIS